MYELSRVLGDEEADLENNLNSWADENADKPIEHYSVFDESGREVGTGSGERGQVKIDTPGLQGTTLVHNHPDGSETLSMQDLQFARSKKPG